MLSVLVMLALLGVDEYEAPNVGLVYVCPSSPDCEAVNDVIANPTESATTYGLVKLPVPVTVMPAPATT